MSRHGNQSGELLGTQALEPGIQAHTLSPLLIMGGSSVEATSLLPVSSLLPPLCWGNGDRGPPSACLNGWKVDRRDSAAPSSSPLPLLHHHHRHHCNVLPPTAPALPLPLPLPPPRCPLVAGAGPGFPTSFCRLSPHNTAWGRGGALLNKSPAILP